jgi:hypothetical protein
MFSINFFVYSLALNGGSGPQRGSHSPSMPKDKEQRIRRVE